MMAEQKASTIGSFPNEIIVQILSYIHPIYSSVLHLRCVCVQWKILIEKTSYLWKHIHLDDDRDCKHEHQDMYKRTLKLCFEKFGDFIQCLRAEDQHYCYDNQIRQRILSLKNLQKLDVPVLLWTRPYAERMKSACGSSIKYVTIDDCKIFDSDCVSGQEIRKAMSRGLEAWDFRFIHSWFPNLEVLCLHTSVHKIARNTIVSILNPLSLKELHLELTPYVMKQKRKKRRSDPFPVFEIMNSKHASILTSLELRYLTLKSKDLMMITKGLHGLKHLVVGSITSKSNASVNTDLCLESSSLRIVFLSSLPSSWTATIKVMMPVLEVLVISQCIDLDSLTIDANCLITLVLRDNHSLSTINAKCESLTDIQIEECSCLEWQSFKDLLKDCSFVERIELSTEWNSIELTRNDCPELRKVILRDVDLDLCRVNIDCPTLEIFKCIGHYVPSKKQRRVRFNNLEISLNSRRLQKVNIRDVFHAEKLTINCQSIDSFNISGRSLLPRPLHMVINASEKIGEISLHELCVQTVSVHCPLLGDFILGNCSLSGDNKCRFKLQCEKIHAMRVLNCNTLRRFSLKVPYLENLTLDSCINMADIDVISEWGTVKNMRIVNCPLLNKTA